MKKIAMWVSADDLFFSKYFFFASGRALHANYGKNSNTRAKLNAIDALTATQRPHPRYTFRSADKGSTLP